MLLKCLVIIVVSCILYLLFGMLTKRLFRLTLGMGEIFLLGFFVYFGLFQVAALPLILSQQKLSLLAKIWVGIVGIVLLAWGWTQRREIRTFFQERKERPGTAWHLKGGISVTSILIAALLLLQLYYMLTSRYSGWDTAYYVGNMNTAVFTDTMYVFDGSSGLKASILNFRYCLSSFYMQGSVVCLLTKLPVLLYCRYVTPAVGWLVSNVIIWEIGRRTVGKREKKYAWWFLGAVCAVNFFFASTYTTSEFLLVRSLEAKSYCANIVIPMIFLIAIRLWERWREKDYWIVLFCVTFACDAISFSSLMLVPVLLTVLCSAMLLVERKAVIFRNYVACMVVPMLYGVIFYFYVEGYIRIMVK